jgi:4-amino-4-deoxy-L-arabinose transferase-like glycosyltransferase
MLAPERMLTRRELLTWAALFLIVSALLVVTRFASDDPDSALYANISAKLADLPASRWIAPEWWGFWDSQGLFREHPAGVFLLPTALSRLGIPPVQAAYIVGIGAGLGSLLLIGWIVSRIGTPAEGRAMLVLLPLMPVAFLFRIRANHEYPMLFCLLLVLVGLDGVRRSSWWWSVLVAIAFTAALLVKGVFIALIFLAAGLWILINPTCAPGSILRPIVACLFACAVMAGVGVAYDRAYLNLTGQHFWGPYWERQLGPLTIATPIEGATTLVEHVVFYVSRLLWHAAPWSFAAFAIAWKCRKSLGKMWHTGADRPKRGLVFAVAFVTLAVALLSPSSRFAERYGFYATYALGTLGALAAWRAWPAVSRVVTSLDQRLPSFPALLWFALIVGRLVIGPFLPRIS